MSGFTADCLHTGSYNGVGTLGTLFLLPALDKLIVIIVLWKIVDRCHKKMFNVILAPIQCVYVEDGILFIANFAVLSIT